MGSDDAREIAVSAIVWLAGTEDLMRTFMGATGTDVDDLRRRVDDPEFLAAVLDFLLLDDAWVMRFAQDTGLRPGDPFAARQALPGGEIVSWT